MVNLISLRKKIIDIFITIIFVEYLTLLIFNIILF